MSQGHQSVPDQVPRKLVRGEQRLRLRFKHDARDQTSKPIVDAYLIDRRSTASVDKANRVVTLVENVALGYVLTYLIFKHSLHLLGRARPIVASTPIQAKSLPATLATIKPPLDLRTQLPKEAEHA